MLTGLVFGLSFYSGLIWWVGKLGLIAVAPLVIVFALYLLIYGWLLGKARRWPPLQWWTAAVGGWAAMEASRIRFPLGGFEWGLAGYPMGEHSWTRAAAQFIGTSGWSVILVAAAAALVIAIENRRIGRLGLATLGIVVLAVLAGATARVESEGRELAVAIVQGSTPCPLTHCFNERRLTFEMHLALTKTIEPGSVDLVVWSEGSTGSFDADPVLVPEVAQLMGAEAQRIGAYLLAGGDRPLSDTQWINANVVFAPDGRLVGEYRKRHPVPFGEYIPARPLFEWIPALDQVPRDMIRGNEPVVFDLEIGRVGSVISFESAFGRYSRDEVKAGAQLIVVATNEGSYEFTSVSDQLMGMTRMRSAEIGRDLVHAAVTGKSGFITNGGVIVAATDFLEETVLYGTVRLSDATTLYTIMGEWVQVLAGAGLIVTIMRRRTARRRTGESAPINSVI
jgi:apolipoprotein N-acyltransferase